MSTSTRFLQFTIIPYQCQGKKAKIHLWNSIKHGKISYHYQVELFH